MKKRLKTILLTLPMLLLSFPVEMRAQQMQATLSHYSTDDGLASNAISYLTHDDYGYVWISTWNGVSRFDGYNFYNYKTGHASGIKGLHNRIDAMTVDQAQNIWLKMYDGRLFVINRHTDCIEDPLAEVPDHDDFRIDYFYTPYVTSGGDILISYKDVGLYKLRLDRTGLKRQLIMTGQEFVTCVTEGYHGDIWAGTNKGIHRADLGNNTLERKGYFLDEYITKITSNGYNIFASTRSGKILQFSYGQEPQMVKDIGREITSLFVDSHDQLWFSDLGDGVYRLDSATGDIKFYKQRVLVPEFTSRGAFFNEVNGVLWIRLNHGGYGYYNRDTDEVEYFHNDPSNPWNLSNSTNANLELSDGVVWLSTSRRGLEKLEILKNTIGRTLMVPNAESMLENETRALYYDYQKQLLLIGNKKGTLFIIDKHGNRQVLTHDSKGQPFGRFYGISGDSKGNYWLCDKDKGVYKMSSNGNGSYTITNFHHDENDLWTLSSNSAYQAVEDSNGNIWIATYGGGVNILVSNKKGGYYIYTPQNKLKKYPSSSFNKVRTIAIDKEDKVWAGTTDGILIMSLQGDKFTVEQLEQPMNMEKGLASNDIVCLGKDQEGDMWVGTNSGGLSCATEKDVNGHWQFENYGIEAGLPSEEIRSLTFDSKGNVWFATDHMLCSFDTKRKILTTFSNLDGVDDTMCSENAAISLPNGRILFGTLNGYYTVDRNKLIAKTGSLLKLRITDFFLNDQQMSPRLSNTFDYYIPESRRVKLPKHGGVMAFRFASLNYQLQHRTHYQYRLLGYESEWNNAGKERVASYRDLPAGNYLFQVKAFLLESPENYDMRTLEVVIPPYFLLSSSAVWFYLFLLMVGGITGLWWYQEQLRKRYQPQIQTFDNDEWLRMNSLQETVDEEKTDAYELMEK
jgi:ligand-binding sensor domain-containing protein